MNDKQFSMGIKISVIVAFVLLIIMGIIAFCTLKSTDVTASVLEDVPEANLEQLQTENM